MGRVGFYRESIWGHVATVCAVRISAVGPIRRHRIGIKLWSSGWTFTETSQRHSILLRDRASLRGSVARRGVSGVCCHVPKHPELQGTIMVPKVHAREIEIEHGGIIKELPLPSSATQIVRCYCLIVADDRALQGNLRPHTREIGAQGRLLGEACVAHAALVQHRRGHLGGCVKIVEWLWLLEEWLLSRVTGHGRISLHSRRMVEKASPNTRHEGLIWCIMEVLGLLSYSILTSILETSFDTSLTRPLVTCGIVSGTAWFSRL